MEARWEKHYIEGAKLAAEKNGPFFIIGMLMALLESEIPEGEKVKQAKFLLDRYDKERGGSYDVV